MAVELGLPPGLHLPSAEVDTEQYRVENFNHPNHDFEQVVEFGAFVTALNVLRAAHMIGENTLDRSYVMPTQKDFRLLFNAGYGLSQRMITHHYGGEGRIQAALNFHPKGSRPGKEAILERLQWMSDYALPQDSTFDHASATVRGVMYWGIHRRLLPGEDVIREALDWDTSNIDRMFGIERLNLLAHNTKQDVYRLGARVIKEHGEPLTQDELNRQYDREFVGKVDNVIVAYFGSPSKFWAEFGFYSWTKGLPGDELIDEGVRFLIANPGARLSYRKIEQMSLEKRFFDNDLIKDRFGSLVLYQEQVAKKYQEYLNVCGELMDVGVSEEILELAARRLHTKTGGFDLWRKHADALVKLSVSRPAARYVRRFIAEGPDLTDKESFQMQGEDLMKYIDHLGISTVADRRFVLGLVPFLDQYEWLPPPKPLPKELRWE